MTKTYIPEPTDSHVNWKTVELYNGEIVVYHEGSQFPLKTAPFPDVIFAIDIVKKTIIESVKLFPFGIALKLLRKRSLEKLLTSFNRIGHGVLKPYMYYRHIGQGELGLTKVSRGVGQITELFLIYYGIDKTIAHQTAEILAHIIEYDAFYRYKVLDVMSEMAWYEAIENPRKEIQRLIMVCHEREQIIGTYIRPKLEILHKMAWILEWPGIKKTLQKTFKETNPLLFRIDEIDNYWMLQRGDYHYFGQSPDDRMKVILKNDWSLPVYRDKDNNVIT